MLPAGSQHSGSSSSTHVSPQSSSQEDLSTSLGATTLSKPLELVSDVKDEDHLPGKSPENGNNCNGIVIECAVCLQNCIHPVKRMTLHCTCLCLLLTNECLSFFQSLALISFATFVSKVLPFNHGAVQCAGRKFPLIFCSIPSF